MQLLRQNTTAVILMGVLRASDGVTSYTGFQMSTADVIAVHKHDGAGMTSISGDTLASLGNGQYTIALTTADTNTAGRLELIAAKAASMQPYRAEFMVVPGNVFDALVLGTDSLDANVKYINKDNTAAINQAAAADAIVPLTCQSGNDTTHVNTNLLPTDTGFFIGRTLIFTSGALATQATAITGYNGATKQLTVALMTNTPSNGDKAVIV